MREKLADIGSILLAHLLKLPILIFFMILKSGMALWTFVKARNSWKFAGISLGAISCLSLAGFMLASWGIFDTPVPKPLYLLDKAGEYIKDTETFEKKVKQVARSLDVPPEWLMAVMYSESRLNPQVRNHKGSGATGLIQFMVPAVKDLNSRLGTTYYMKDIRNMPAHDQMELVYEYLQTVRERYGDYYSLTDLYLAILYPKALAHGASGTLYSKPSLTYYQNIGLDENKDGHVTKKDIDARMMRLFPDAFHTSK